MSRNQFTFAKDTPQLLGDLNAIIAKLNSNGYLSDMERGLILNTVYKTSGVRDVLDCVEINKKDGKISFNRTPSPTSTPVYRIKAETPTLSSSSKIVQTGEVEVPGLTPTTFDNSKTLNNPPSEFLTTVFIQKCMARGIKPGGSPLSQAAVPVVIAQANLSIRQDQIKKEVATPSHSEQHLPLSVKEDATTVAHSEPANELEDVELIAPPVEEDAITVAHSTSADELEDIESAPKEEFISAAHSESEIQPKHVEIFVKKDLTPIVHSSPANEPIVAGPRTLSCTASEQSASSSPFKPGEPKPERPVIPYWKHFVDNIDDHDKEQARRREAGLAATLKDVDHSSFERVDIFQQTTVTEDGQRLKVGGKQKFVTKFINLELSTNGEEAVAVEQTVPSSPEETKVVVESVEVEDAETGGSRTGDVFTESILIEGSETEGVGSAETEGAKAEGAETGDAQAGDAQAGDTQTEGATTEGTTTEAAQIKGDDCIFETKKPVACMSQVQVHEDGDVLGTSTPPLIENNEGLQMMAKMGYKPRIDLGKDSTSILAPLIGTIKNSRAGVGVDLKAAPVLSPEFTCTVEEWDILHPRASASSNIPNENEGPKNVAAPTISDWDTLYPKPTVSRDPSTIESQNLQDITVLTIGSGSNVQAEENDTTAVTGNASKVQTQPPKNKATPKTSDVPKKPLHTNPQIVRFISEGPPSPRRFKFKRSTTGGRNAMQGPTNHYVGAVIEARDKRLGDGKFFFATEKGDRFEVLEKRNGKGEGDYKYLVQQTDGERKRGFLNILKAEMTPAHYEAASRIPSPTPLFVTSQSSGNRSSRINPPPMAEKV